MGIEIYDVGARDRKTHIPREILDLLQFIERPHSPDNIKAALRVLVSRQLIPTQDLNPLATNPEQFLYPGPLDRAAYNRQPPSKPAATAPLSSVPA